MEKYRKLYEWDPVEMVNNQAKTRVAELKNEGRSDKEIFKIYEDDPFVKIK